MADIIIRLAYLFDAFAGDFSTDVLGRLEECLVSLSIGWSIPCFARTIRWEGRIHFGEPELARILEGKAMHYEFEKGQNGVDENMHVSGQRSQV